MEEFRTLVVYRSKHGTTKKYAHWIADALNADVMSADKNSSELAMRLKSYDMVIYGGNVNERGVNGIAAMKALVEKHGVENMVYYCVGSFPASEETRREHFEASFKENERSDAVMFYFRGRLDYLGLGFLEKRMMSGLMKAIEKKYPEDRTEAEAEILEAYYDDIDWSDKSYVTPLVEYVQSFMTEEQKAMLAPLAEANMAARLELEAEEEAAWEAEMKRREDLHNKNKAKDEEFALKRLSKKKRAEYLRKKAEEEIRAEEADEDEDRRLLAGEDVDGYDTEAEEQE